MTSDPFPTATSPLTAAGIARERLETYLREKLSDEDDLSTWEFYNWLLEKAMGRRINHSGYIPAEYKSDQELARVVREEVKRLREEK